MAPSQIITVIGGALVAAGQYLMSNANIETPPPAGGEGGEPAKRGRGRPQGGGKTEEPNNGGDAAPTDDERFAKNRALIKPLIDAAQGEDVKKVIAKYSKTGLKDIPAASQADFAKDIEALAY